MASLEELLALLPTNGTGEISAADLREVVSSIWEAGAGVEARVTALELADSGGSTFNLDGIWQTNANAGAEPGGKQVTADSAFRTATWLRFDRRDKDNVDFTNALLACQKVFAQQKQSAENWISYQVTGAVDTGTYIELSVTVLRASESELSGNGAWQDAIVVMQGIPVALGGA